VADDDASARAARTDRLAALTDRTRRAWVAHPMVAAVLPGLLLVAVGLIGFAVMLDSVRDADDFTVLDEPVLAWLVAHRTPLRTAGLLAVTFVSGPVVLPVLVGIGALTWGLVAREWWRPVLLVGAMAASGALGLVAKSGVGRTRPPMETQVVPGAETTFSFPSGHTIGTATLCLVAGYLVWSRRPSTTGLVVWGVTTVVLTGVVGLSRLYLGYHFLTDVLAAASLAVAVLGAVVVIDRLHELRLRSGPAPAPPIRP
jgi:membrane-associated phospholipid phosphatase